MAWGWITLNDSLISNFSSINGSNSDDTIIFNQTSFFDNSAIDLSQTGSDQLILTGLFASINESSLTLGNGDELIEDQTSISQIAMGVAGDGFADTFIFVGPTSVADHSITGFTQNEDVIDLTSFGLMSAADLNFQFDGSDTTLNSVNNPVYEITVIGVELTAADVGTDIII